MVKPLLRVLVVLGIAANIGFLLINLSPERPRLGKRTKVKLLLPDDEAGKKWLTENVLDEFAATHDVDFELVMATDPDQVVAKLKEERDKPTGLMLAAIDNAQADAVIAQGLAKPIADVVPPEALARVTEDYIPEALEQGRDKQGKQWFLPRRGQIDVSVFLRPAVEQAFLGWEEDRAAIDAALAKANGVGLPKGFVLKRSPDQWNTYDLFVAAWYWAHHPAPWTAAGRGGSGAGQGGQGGANGQGETAPTLPPISPRVAFRGGSHGSGMRDLIGGFYRHGLKESELGQVDRPPIIDALQWQAIFLRHGLVVEDKHGLNAAKVRELLRNRQIAWAPINQRDSFWLHGGAERDAARGMRGSRDLGWSMRPAGVSLALKDGLPARGGKPFSFMAVQMWVVPVHCPLPELAFRLARFSGRRTTHQRETEAQGMLPIRADIQRDYSIIFRLEWMQRILDASFRQVRRGSAHMPDVIAEKHYDALYERVRDAVLGQASTIMLSYDSVRHTAMEAAAHGP